MRWSFLVPALVYLGASLLPASEPAAAPPAGSRLPRAADSFYNNNPAYALEPAPGGGGPIWTKNLVELKFKVYDPVFSPDRIFLKDGRRVAALDPATGTFTWEKTFDRDVDRCLADGDLFLYASHRWGLLGGVSWLKAESLSAGKALWEVEEPWQAAGLQVYDNHAYRFRFNGVASFHLCSYDPKGKLEWTYKTKGMAHLFFFDDLVVLAPPGLKKILGLRRADGTEAWSLPLEHDTADDAFHDGVFYTAYRTWNPLNLPGGSLYASALDLASGKPIWHFTLSADDGWFPETIGGVVTDGRFAILSTSRHLYCLDARTGELLWKADPEEKQKFLRTKPIILNGSLFSVQTVKDTTSVFQFLDLASGKEQRRMTIPDELIPPAKVVGRALFLCFRHGDMLALPLVEPAEGARETKATGSGEAAAAPIQQGNCP